jgi:molybdopterin molybdotransferase
MDAAHGPVSRATAIDRLTALREGLRADFETERVEPGSGIRQRTVSAEVVATSNRPAHDRAMMDGYAVDATATYPLEIVDAVFPEDEPPSVPADSAVEITTGAPLPESASAVIRSEDAVLEDGRLCGPNVDPGTYTYREGANVAAGDIVFEQGEQLGARDAMLLDDLGVGAVPVYRPFEVAVLATGTEIHDDPSLDRDSNMLLELIDAWGATPTFEGAVPDDLDAVRDAIADLAAEYDVVMTTGGTSHGSKDYVVSALDDLGRVDFHGIQFRPGKSLAVAELESAVALAIPGKPFAAYSVTAFVLRPFFTGAERFPTVEGRCAVDVGLPDREFIYGVPVSMTGSRVVPLGHEASDLPIYGDVFESTALASATRVARADGAVLRETPISAGERVTVVPFEALE